MPYRTLRLPPGIDNSGTSYSREGRWSACDKVRFIDGQPAKIGGWQPYTTTTPTGVVRALVSWSDILGGLYMGIGTSRRYLVYRSGLLYNITPFRRTQTRTNPFSTTNGSNVVTVTDNEHLAVTGDTVVISNATAVGGLTLNGEFIVTVLTIHTYTITASSNATATATGGGTVTLQYELNIGEDNAVSTSGWGQGTWSAGPWGTFGTGGFFTRPRLWSHTAYGEDLAFCPVNGAIYYWDSSAGTSTRGVLLSSLAGASAVPGIAFAVAAGQARQLIAYGANPLGATAQDPMFVRWSDTENAANWTPTVTNTAGGYRLAYGSRIVAIAPSDQQTLIFTDAAVYLQQFVGGAFVYSFQLVPCHTPPVSINASVTVSGTTYWMARGGFYTFRGGIQMMQSPVAVSVFEDINYTQIDQVCCGINAQFDEIWWHYPSSSAAYNDKYVVYNYKQNIWYVGTMGRTAWLDSPLFNTLVAAKQNTPLLQHEFGSESNEGAGAQAMTSFIETADFDIDDGDYYAFIDRLIPDIRFTGSSATQPSLAITVGVRNAPGAGAGQTYVQTAQATAVSPVNLYSDTLYYRLRGRQMRLRVASTDTGVKWILGSTRLSYKPDGRKS